MHISKDDGNQPSDKSSSKQTLSEADQDHGGDHVEAARTAPSARESSISRSQRPPTRLPPSVQSAKLPWKLKIKFGKHSRDIIESWRVALSGWSSETSLCKTCTGPKAFGRPRLDKFGAAWYPPPGHPLHGIPFVQARIRSACGPPILHVIVMIVHTTNRDPDHHRAPFEHIPLRTPQSEFFDGDGIPGTGILVMQDGRLPEYFAAGEIPGTGLLVMDNSSRSSYARRTAPSEGSGLPTSSQSPQNHDGTSLSHQFSAVTIGSAPSTGSGPLVRVDSALGLVQTIERSDSGVALSSWTLQPRTPTPPPLGPFFMTPFTITQEQIQANYRRFEDQQRLREQHPSRSNQLLMTTWNDDNPDWSAIVYASDDEDDAEPEPATGADISTIGENADVESIPDANTQYGEFILTFD